MGHVSELGLAWVVCGEPDASTKFQSAAKVRQVWSRQGETGSGRVGKVGRW